MSALFFFQAEDGIRDLTVTGVQTCALPIYRDVGYAGGTCGPLGRMCRRRTPRHDDIHVKADQLGREVSERFNSSVGEPRLESDVLALTVSALGQPSTELFDVG